MSEKSPEYCAWVDRAKEDLLCIRNELAAAEKPWSVICFHAEQAAEKYLVDNMNLPVAIRTVRQS